MGHLEEIMQRIENADPTKRIVVYKGPAQGQTEAFPVNHEIEDCLAEVHRIGTGCRACRHIEQGIKSRIAPIYSPGCPNA